MPAPRAGRFSKGFKKCPPWAESLASRGFRVAPSNIGGQQTEVEKKTCLEINFRLVVLQNETTAIRLPARNAGFINMMSMNRLHSVFARADALACADLMARFLLSLSLSLSLS
jgi:hypothetical protein